LISPQIFIKFNKKPIHKSRGFMKLHTQFRKSISEYSTKDILALFNTQYNCIDCPFKYIYKGPIPFGCGTYHRFYCSHKYIYKRYLPLIIGETPEKIESEIPKINNNTSIIDIVRLHPTTKNIADVCYILSVLYLKEFCLCPIDQHNLGINPFDPITEQQLRAYREKHNLPNPPQKK